MTKEPKRRTITVDAVFDIETQDWVKFVAGGILYSDGRYEEYTFRNGGEREMADTLLQFKGTVWAHNGGGFDFKWLLDYALEYGLPVRITSAGGTIICVMIGDLRLFDSFALTKISLAELSKGSGLEKVTTDLPCICGNYCGGYCSIRRDMSPEEFAKMLLYLKRDCEALFESLTVLQAFAETHDLDLGATVGGSAWRNAQRLLNLPKANLEVSDHMFCRDSYFGGRVQLLKPYSDAGWEYDVNSMYPSRLANCELPTGNPSRNWGRTSQEDFEAGAPGFYTAQVIVPSDLWLPPLPVRTRERIMYPVGEFRGTWALPELQLAAELGCSIECFESLVFPSKEVIFKPWIDRLFNVRTNAPGGKKGAMGTFVKYYLNSLTGKFGSRPQAERVMLNVPADKLKSCRCKHDCDGACGCDIPLGIHGDITIRRTFRIDNCAHIEWASYLTSEARCEWLRFALSSDSTGRSIVYGDTDSVFSERKMSRNIGDELGQWQCQGEYTRFRGIAPKVYTFERGEKRTLKAKGVALTRQKDAPDEVKALNVEKDCRRLFAGDTFRKDGPQGFRKGAKNGKFFEKSEQSRSVSSGYGDREFDSKENCTRPPTYSAEKHGGSEPESECVNEYEEIANSDEDW